MKRYKLIAFILALSLIVVLNNKYTYSYFASSAKTEINSFTLGNLKLETDNNQENKWRYVPVGIRGSSNSSNDLIDTKKLSNSLSFDNIRPGDAFEKDITITSLGSLNTKLKITKGEALSSSPFDLVINLKSKDKGVEVSNDSKDKSIWYAENLRPNSKVTFTVRLELPTKVTNKDLNESNMKLSNDAFKLLNIVAAQWNNDKWSE